MQSYDIGPYFGANIDYFSKYLRKKLTQNLTPQRPSSPKPYFGANIDYFSRYLRKTLTQNLTPQRPGKNRIGAREARAGFVDEGLCGVKF